MEKKKTIWDDNPLRTIFSDRHFNINFFRKLSLSKLSSVDGAGFTLIEVLITIALIVVMAVGIIMMLNPLAQIQKARDASRKSDLSQIQKALETYYNDNGKYPPTGGTTSTPNYAIIGLDEKVVDWDTPWLPYMSKLPKDPSSSKNYVYNSPVCPPTCPAGQSYYLYASLDRGSNDVQVCNAGKACVNVPAGAGCGSGAVCNYGVSSSNVSP